MIIHKICKWFEVEQWTRQGWALVAAHSSTVAEKISLQTPLAVEGTPASNGSYGHPGSVHNGTREEVVQAHEPLFLLAKEDAIILREEQLLVERDEARKRAEAVGKERDQAIVELKHVQDALGPTQSRLNEVSLQGLEERKTMRKLEADIGKIREAVGSQRMKEILGS